MTGGTASIDVCYLADDADVELLAARLLGGDGPPDVLINSAGAGAWRAT